MWLLTFSGGIEMEHWTKMGLSINTRRKVCSNLFTLIALTDLMPVFYFFTP